MSVALLSPDQADIATSVLCEAFFDYPVMRHVLGGSDAYPGRLRTLVGFFVAARFLRQDVVLGVLDSPGDLAAVALVTLPGERPYPEALAARRAAVWGELGSGALGRYEAYGAASRKFDVDEPHHHLNMIGVRRSSLGRGHARALLEQVHDLADTDPGSSGVTLSTETRANVGLYEHFGYLLRGHAVVTPELETWALYRPKRGRGPRA